MVSQRLIVKPDTKGRVAVVEIMINSPLISDLIFKGEVSEIKEVMKKSTNMGMQTFDQALFNAYEIGDISYEDALRNADSVPGPGRRHRKHDHRLTDIDTRRPRRHATLN